MRDKARIPNVMAFFKDNKVKKKFLADILPTPYKIYIEDATHLWWKYEKLLEEIWGDNPELRLTQLLINQGILPNAPGLWYYIEEMDYIKDNNLNK